MSIDSRSAKKKNIEVNNQLRDQFSSKSHDDFDDKSQNDRFVLDTNRNFTEIVVVFRFLFVLQC